MDKLDPRNSATKLSINDVSFTLGHILINISQDLSVHQVNLDRSFGTRNEGHNS